MENLDLLVRQLIALPSETEWVELKRNNDAPDEIGEYISALSNAAVLHDKEHAYLIWGIDDDSHNIVGTTFDPRTKKIGKEELENWLRRLLTPNANFAFFSLAIDNKDIVVLIIEKALSSTVQFKQSAYIRVGSYKKRLSDHPAMEKRLWEKINGTKYEEMLAKQHLQASEVLRELNYSAYFELLDIALPSDQKAILHYLTEDRIIKKQDDGLYAITNLGATLFAKKLVSFDGIARKCIRVIQYRGKNRVETIREDAESSGYAAGFERVLKYIEGLLPANEEIVGALRRNIVPYPLIAIRELVANALIHQDFSVAGAGPMVELFDDRIEITNPGIPLIDIKRFIDNPPRSRNEMLAALMRRAKICEERGSGWDKVALLCEENYLPAPKIEIYSDMTKVTLFSWVPFNRLTQEEKLWSCYMHACLKQVSNEQMTNTSLRERFNLSEKNKSSVSRLITSAVAAKLIKPLDPFTAPRYLCYIPIWA